MRKVTVHFNSQLHHFSQLLADLEYLNRQGEIELIYKINPGQYPGDIFRIDVDGLMFFFDLSDNSRIYNQLYETSDFYVKRMLLKTDAAQMSKLIPYGFYFPAYLENRTMKYLFLKDRKYLKYAAKYWNFPSRLFRLKDSISVNHYLKIHSPPSNSNIIFFRARLWNPANNEVLWKKEERNLLNHQRIEINRLLQQKFPSEFIGGILKDEYSLQQCPDLILSMKDYHRKNYLKILKNAAIGIVNQGLEGSIGAKMGEYVSNSLAILSNPIDQFELPGSFAEHLNFLPYKSVEECVSLVVELSQNHQLRKDMQENNSAYYAEYLRPGQKILKILEQAGVSD